MNQFALKKIPLELNIKISKSFRFEVQIKRKFKNKNVDNFDGNKLMAITKYMDTINAVLNGLSSLFRSTFIMHNI